MRTIAPRGRHLLLVVLGLGGLLLSWRLATHFSLDDFRVYRRGAIDAVAGRDPYAAELPEQTYTYTPFSLMVFRPLAALSFRMGAAGFSAASLLGLVAISIVLWREASIQWVGSQRGLIFALGAIMFLSEPSLATLAWGQIDIILMAVVLIDLVGRDGRLGHGALIGVAAAIKLTPLVFLPYLLVSGRRRAAANGLVAAVVATGLAWLVFPDASSRFFGHLVFRADRVGPLGFAGNQSVLAMFVRLTGSASSARPWWLVGSVGVVVLGGWLAPRARARWGELAGIAVASWVGLLVSPVSWTHHWVWWVVPAALLGGVVSRHPTPAGVGGLVAWSGCFLFAPMWAAPRNMLGVSPVDLRSTLLVNSYLWCGLFGMAVMAWRVDRVVGAPNSSVRQP